MDKKVTIKETGLLKSLDDDWGGVNDTSGPIIPYASEGGRTVVPAGQKWGMNHQEIENFVKERLRGNFGALRTKVEDNYVHVLCFNTADDAEAWDDDNTLENYLQDLNTGISTVTGATYSSRLFTSIDNTSAPIVLTEAHYNVPLRFCGVMNDNGDISNAGVNGTVTIERSPANTENWSPMGTQQLPSRDLNYTNYDSIDIGSYLQEGDYQFRFRASFPYVDSEGVNKTAYSTYITLQHVIYSDMQLTFSAQWQRPFSGNRVNVGFYIKGYGQMFLNVTCDNVTVVNSLAVTTTTETPQAVEITNANLLTNGVHTLRAWLVPSADGTVQSEAIEAQFLYFDPSTATEQEKARTYIMVNSIVSTVQPYVEAELMQYAVYKYGAETVPLGIRLTNAGLTTTYLSQDLGNVPVETAFTYQNALKIPQGITTAYLYFAIGGTIQTGQYWALAVDQSIDYNPTPMNANGFRFDPSVRSNNEDHPETVINANTGQAVAATWSNDMAFKTPKGYVADDNGTVHLHLDAGDKLHITGYDPFSEFITDANASMTMMMKIKTSNVYNEKEPVLRVGTVNNGKILGFEMLPLTAYHLTEQQSSRGSQDVQLQEDECTFIALNIVNNLGGRGLNFVRMFVNGIINREYIYGIDRFVADGGSGGIVIGSDSACVDVYSIDVYKQALSSHNVMQNYKSGILEAAKKLAFHRANDILGGDNTISYAKTSEMYSTMLWIPDDITKPYLPNYTNGANSSYSKGTLKVIFRYRYSGNGHNAGDINFNLSRIYTKLKIKGQGTSSMTYWTWNLRFQFTDASEVWSVNAALNADTLLLSGSDCYFIFEEGGAHVTKADAKANWASSSQSHKMGMMNAYGALWKQIIGTQSPIYASDQRTRPCVLQEAFMFFVQDVPGSDSSIRFSNFMTFGPAKNDKATWGLGVKSPHYISGGSQKSMYTCLEGSSNGRELVEGKVPWIPEEVFYFFDPADSENKMNETFIYNGVSHFDFDKGPSNTQNEGQENEYDVPKGFTYVGDNKWQETEDMDFPQDDVYGAGSGNTIKFYRRAWNLVYLCNPNLEAIEGDYNTLQQMAENEQLEQGKQYFVMVAGQGHQKGDCFRWNPLTETWVNGGISKDASTEDGYAILNLFTDLSSYMPSTYNANDAISLTNAFQQARLARYRAESPLWWRENDCDLCQAWGKITAAKDNWCKNTYFILNPDGLLSMNRDDDDTILDKDNVGKTGTPYQVEEHDRYNDDGEWADANGRGEVWDAETGQYNIVENARNTYFNSQDSVLFTLREKTRPELKAMVGTIFQTMVQLEGSVEAFFQKYFFDIQEYFPAVAYNEVARLLYEEAKIQMAAGNYTNNTDPMTQSLGDQLQGEKQWIKRRIPYMESYGNSSVFADANGRGALSFRSSLASTDSGTTHSYIFKVTPHQFLYPSAGSESGYAYSNHRTRPGETVALPALTVTQNNNVFIFGIDYLRSVGDFAEHPTEANSSMSIVGERLTEWIINADGAQAVQNRSTAMSFSCPHLQRLIMRGHTALSSLGGDSLSKMDQAEEIDLRGCTGITSLRFPDTATLKTVKLPATMTAVNLTGQPMLETLTMDGYDSVKQFVVTGSPLLGQSVQSHVLMMKDAGVELDVLKLTGIYWPSTVAVNASVIRWLLDIPVCELKGHDHSGEVTVQPDIYVERGTASVVTYDDVARLIVRYGDVRSEENDLYISFGTSSITVDNIAIKGKKYINTNAQSEGYDLDEDGKYNGLSIAVSGGNDVGVSTNGAGNMVPNVKWELVAWDETEGDYVPTTSQYAVFADPYSPVLTVSNVTSAVTPRLTVRMTLTTTAGTARKVTKKIGLWNRVPEVGDYAWTDGEFDNENDPSKKLSGMVIMRQMLDANGNVTTDISECVAYKLWIYGAADSTMPANDNINDYGSYEIADSNVSTQCWGLYPKGTNGVSMKPYYFDDAKSNGTAYDDPMLQDILEEVRGKSFGGKPFNSSGDIFNTPLSDLSGDIYLKKNAAACTATNHRAMQDTSNVANNGWKVNSDAHLNNFDSEGEKATLMAYADAVLAAVLRHHGINNEDLPEDCVDSEGNVHPRTRQALSNLMQIVMMYCAREELSNVFSNSAEDTYAIGDHVIYNEHYYTCTAATTGGTFDESCWTDFNISDLISGGTAFRAIYPSRYRELLFPAARLADTWCPADATSINEGLTEAQLDDQYKRGKWMLPSSALLARIYNFLGNSRPTSYTTSEGPSETMANESDELLEAEKPLFANAMARGRSVSVSYSSYHWSSTESLRTSARTVNFLYGLSYTGNKYGGVVVRPVAAFTFVP